MESNCDAVKFWLDTAGRYPVLKPEQVLVLARCVQANPPGSKKRQRAIQKLVTHNLKLIPRIATRVMKSKHSKLSTIGYIEDIYQSGVIGLTRAAELYDPQKGYAFSTYATAWVYQSMQRYVYNNMSLVRVPESTIREYYSVWKNSSRSELADLDQKKIERYVDAHRALGCFSLDSNMPSIYETGRQINWIEAIPGEDEYEIHDTFHELLSLSNTSEASKAMVVEYFEQNTTMQHIADSVGVSRNKVSDMINECLNSIRKHLPLV